MVRARFHLWESGSTAQMVDALGGLRGSHGVVLKALEQHPNVEAVYSVVGGNTATVAAFEALGRVCRVFVAHDLDADNRRLLREGRISVVLHNDLRVDARLAMPLILQERGALPVEPPRPVPIQVITPYNLPS
jgi:LacI family transcriptional regulator